METALEQGDLKESPSSLPFPTARWGRVLYGIYITIMPVLAFSATEPLKPQWQSGRFSDYIVLLLFPEASLVFFSLLAYSILCYILLLISPAKYARWFFIRLGIYTGALLALQYSILELYTGGASVFLLILIWIFPLICSLIYRQAIARWTAERVNRFLLIVGLGSLLIASLITKGSAAFLVLIVLTMAAPFWSLLLALQAGTWLFKNHETRLTVLNGLGLTTWLAAYAGAWRFDILKMYELYAALPPAPPPDCYIATAAARGHPRFVHARTVQHPDGACLQVNAQLQMLKCAELALLAIQPHWHTILRRLYDRVGKGLAHQIENPYLADLAYLLLKPCEWLAGWILKIIVPEIDSFSRSIYIKE